MPTSQTLTGWSSKLAGFAAGTIIVVGGGFSLDTKLLLEKFTDVQFIDSANVLEVMAGLKEPLLFDNPSVLRDDMVINFICPDIDDGNRTLKGACLVNIIDNQYMSEQPHVKKVQTGVSDFSSDFKMSTSN